MLLDNSNGALAIKKTVTGHKPYPSGTGKASLHHHPRVYSYYSGGKTMPRKIKVAAVQMDANPDSTAERLARAEGLVAQASQAGAGLVVLPELFNTGYAYTDANFQLAEPFGGKTSVWMKTKASQFNVHLAGSLMLSEDDDIYNALLLFSPSGKMWRYDKGFPWAWERGYFRGRANSKMVARTDLGDLGMLICWDVGHRSRWKQYAGQVDMMVVSSCPVDGSDPTYHFPDGNQLTFKNFGPMFATLKDSAQRTFREMLNQQTAWLGVPCVSAAAGGQIRTPIPRGFASLFSMLAFAPWIARYLPQAEKMEMSCRMVEACKVVDADGQVVAERAQSQGEGFAIAEVTLPEVKPLPRGNQPVAPLSWLAYFTVDIVIPFLMRRVYKEGLAKSLAR
jgi:predicted amidohydrolase